MEQELLQDGVSQQGQNSVRLNKIVLQGFKSFQRRTAIPLFPGFNAIIGPNGSGKSNALDAICFVLGRSSRGIRAGRLDQIIYNGGKDSKPADYALVELSIDNSSGRIQNQPAEIIVSRKVNRQGVSVYRINSKTVTREELVDAVRQAAIDPDGHNIIQQGDVTEIIERKPKERREVLDEIAGVREYQEKKDKSIKELDIAQKNVDEATAVLKQKEEFLDKIRKERDIALKHQEIEQALRLGRANLAFTRIKAVESTLENILRNLELKEEELKTMCGKVDSFDSELDQKENRVKASEKEILQKSVNATLRKEIDDLNTRVLKRQGQINANEREIDRLNEMIDTLLRIKGKRGVAIVSGAVKTILGLGKRGIEGTIAQLGKVDSKFEQAIDVAAGGHLNDVVVDTEQLAIECVEYLKKNNLGRVRFLPLDRIRVPIPSTKADLASKQPGIVDYAVNLIKFDKKYESAFKYVFSDTLVGENIDAARKIKGVRIVTLEGDLFEAGGAIVGGRFRKAEDKADLGDITDVKEYENAKTKLEQENVQLRQEASELEKLLNEKRAIEDQESSEVREIDEQKNALTAEIEEMKRSRRSQYEQRILLETEVQNFRLQKARLEAEHEGLKVDYEPYKEQGESGQLTKGDMEKLDREIKKFEKQLRDIGLINMKALEEYDLFSKDYGSSKEKLEQLYAERNSIKGMIEKLEERRKGIFHETLAAIAKEFANVFADLVGGTAEVSLENPEDIESGLIIKAQPRGKQLLHLDAMSGGETSLTALAFLFAIMRHKAAPFYLLDEIDAALDKENSEKVSNLVQKYAQSSQFIVITHNDATARRADRIYGVSMQKGVSQILGVKL